MRKIIRILFLVTMLITVSCNSKKVENNIVEVPKESKVIKVDKTGTFEYELNNLNGEDVYFIFTNESDSSISRPVITKNINSKPLSRNIEDSSENAVLKETHQRGSSKVTESNRKLAEELITKPKTNKSINKNVIEQHKALLEGEKEDFFGSNNETVPATLRKVQSAHGITLYIWVANHSWYDVDVKKTKIEQYMVDIFANKFLKEGTDNDIYEWVSNIVGEPWGDTSSHSWYKNLIADDRSIHILLYDIDNDDSTTGGVGGYYWAKHNFNKAYYSTSNEKIMFAIDSVMFANKEGDNWEISDYWPQEMVSTLAHEFQHMVDFYQKTILRGVNSQAWINELASMAIEDLVARKILADGPRGVNYNTGTSGANNNGYGRIPLYNRNNNKKLTEWIDNDLRSYSMSYTFGAYLMRNYGGANFIKNLVKNNKNSKESVTEALKLTGYNVTFNETLRNFAVANLLSDSTNHELGYRFNKDTWETSIINGIKYDLGAINLYNYNQRPKIYATLPTSLNGISNHFYDAGKDLIGNNKWTISGLDSSVKMTIVIKK